MKQCRPISFQFFNILHFCIKSNKYPFSWKIFIFPLLFDYFSNKSLVKVFRLNKTLIEIKTNRYVLDR